MSASASAAGDVHRRPVVFCSLFSLFSTHLSESNSSTTGQTAAAATATKNS